MPLLDVADMAVHLPPDSATARSLDPDWRWTTEAQLLAAIADSLRWLQWAKTKDGQKNRNQPEPIPRPGVGRDSADTKVDVIGAWEGFDSIEEARDWYETRFPGRLTARRALPPRDARGRFVKRS